MTDYRLDTKARDDLDGIYDYIAFDNEPAAERLIDRLHEAFGLIATQSLLGELRPELAPHLRSFVVGNYVILYRPVDVGIEIARVIHAARDISSLF